MLLYLHQSFKMDCCLTNSDAHVAGGSEDGKIYFWDLVDAQVVTSFQAHSSVVTTLFFFFILFLFYRYFFLLWCLYSCAKPSCLRLVLN